MHYGAINYGACPRRPGTNPAAHPTKYRRAPGSHYANVRYELEIRELIVRVEEELKHQRELMLQGFEMSNKRAEELRADMNKRFEQVDKRFEQMDRRFEQIDKHLAIITNSMDWFMFWSLGLTVSAIIAIVKLT